MPSKDPRRSIAQRLDDMLENIDATRQFVDGKTFEQFSESRMLLYAVTRAIEIISEASRHLPEEVKARAPHINWRGVANVGNVYRHIYDQVEERYVWDLVQTELEPMRSFVVAELKLLGFDRA